MGTRKLDHIALAVKSLDDALGFYVDILGLKLLSQQDLPDQGIRAAFLDMGGARLELMEPLGGEGPVQRFLERQGEGVHHIAMASADVAADCKAMEPRGVWIAKGPADEGAEGEPVAFIHPASACGVTVELVERDKAQGDIVD